jgi:hypothetical protein
MLLGKCYRKYAKLPYLNSKKKKQRKELVEIFKSKTLFDVFEENRKKED